ncbi:MAG: Histidine--tRNA ligase [Alphaproteobacteria bacterium MarineAlpha5_Bin9]|nr:MAG: Histidine--tRNA ligase [Alphaproteobacteria bacterium MarineAlpha5_Bin9]|tara:strand:- start:10243 stop:11517 length:1275 start_codon:yes stop_codon:yes gene_type:complete
MSIIQPARGTHDYYGDKINLYNRIRSIISKIAKIYDFKEIQTPIFELSNLFKKPLGENSDVILKEMYTFEDKNETMLSLRPEFTTPIIRAAISNNLISNLPLKLFSFGPTFRRERPQKGRYRQFNQINFEIFGTHDPYSDVELINLADKFLKEIFSINKLIEQNITLEINSLGDIHTIQKYKENLTTYYEKYKFDLSEDSVKKIKLNPLRILDSKKEIDNKINLGAPKIKNFYSKESHQAFDKVQSYLNNENISYKINNNLVRGLDYYCHTVFEYKTSNLGTQDTLIGGGRYDGLIKNIGGPDVPGVGWAGGVERILLMLKNLKENKAIVELIILDDESKEYGTKILSSLRNKNVSTKYSYNKNIKKILKRASNENINFVIIVGENELNNKTFVLKDLKKEKQEIIKIAELDEIIKNERFKSEN